MTGLSGKIAHQAEEAELIDRLRKGDESAFRQVVESRKDLVYNTVLGLLQHPEDAEDVAQDVFIKMYESIHQFKGESAFSTWLYRIAVTKALEWIRSRKRKKRFAFITGLLGDNNELRHDPPDFHHPGVQLDNKERAARLFKSIAQLPDNQRVAFTLHKVEGIPYLEIAAIMELSVSAIESLIHRAKKNLRKDLEDYYMKNG
jgi:RNA polymerase sigma-70 factor (ECF subfamily)